MPHDLSASDLADRARDQYIDMHESTRHLPASAAWDSALVVLALQQVRLARDAVASLGSAGELPSTKSLGTSASDALPSLRVAEEELACALRALGQL